MVFFDRVNHFEGVALPYEVQVAPGFAVKVGDFDGDGRQHNSKLLIQNSFQDQTGIFPYVAELLWHQQKGVPMAGISGAKRGKPECDFR